MRQHRWQERQQAQQWWREGEARRRWVVQQEMRQDSMVDLHRCRGQLQELRWRGVVGLLQMQGMLQRMLREQEERVRWRCRQQRARQRELRVVREVEQARQTHDKLRHWLQVLP